MNFNCELGQVSYTTRHEMTNWLAVNVGQRGVVWDYRPSTEVLWRYKFYFKHKKSQTMFLLRWA